MHRAVSILVMSVSVQQRFLADEMSIDAESLFRAARSSFAESPESAVALLKEAAALGHAESQKMLGLAYAQGLGGIETDSTVAVRWFRAAAKQGDNEAAYNMVALCNAQPSCIASTSEDQVLSWLQHAAVEGHSEAAYQSGNIEYKRSRIEHALEHFRLAAKLGHARAMYNIGHILSARLEKNATQGLARVLGWFSCALRAARVQQEPKVEADAIRALWVWLQEPDLKMLSGIFIAGKTADEALASGVTPDMNDGLIAEVASTPSDIQNGIGEQNIILEWQQGIDLWNKFESAYASLPSTRNLDALRILRDAMRVLERSIQVDASANRGLGEFRRNMVLAKLVQGSKFLSQDVLGMAKALRWHIAFIETPLCAGLYAQVETSVSCFNDQLVAAITLSRRLKDVSTTEKLMNFGLAHPSAATHWISSLQTPRIFHPSLRAKPWWEVTKFKVASDLEAAWSSGAMNIDIERLGIAGNRAAGGERVFERIVSNGVRSAQPSDDNGAGSWSEFKLFDGSFWNDERCELVPTFCSVLRASAEVSGTTVAIDGTALRQQGEVTIYRLLPGSQILPHSGVTNQALVLHFPLVGVEGVRFRVADEWRNYEYGKALIFDDSFEHEVIHQGKHERYVLFAVLHHPDLGVPVFDDTSKVIMETCQNVSEVSF